ncbi:hypothetical protein ACHAXR_008696 [Thalassiosira sp. AJA248-18]
MSHPLYAAPKPKSNEQVPHTAYQVDFVAINCGRIVAASKRRIRFKFGYTNTEALRNGETGQECRGSEHEVSITWSLSSGKQAIAFDQHEVFFDVGDSSQTKISHSFKDQLGHNLSVKIHAAPMSSKANPDPDWKQYDLMIDGVSFFKMPKIFQIGIFAKENAADSSRLSPKFAQYPSSRASHMQAGQFRNDDSNSNMGLILPPDGPKIADPEPAAVADLLSFDEFDAPAPAPAVAAPPTQAAPAQANYAPAQAPVQTGQLCTCPGSGPDWPIMHLSRLHQGNPFEPPQAQDQVINTNCVSPNTSPGIQGNNHYLATSQPFEYDNQNAAPPTTPAQSNQVSNLAPTTLAFAQQPNPVTPTASSTAIVPVQPAPTSYGVDGAAKKLVDLDDLFGTSTAAPVTKESIDSKMQEANAHKSLGQLQGSTDSNPKRQVMNTFNPAPAYQQQQPGMCHGYPAQQQQQQQQPQYNNYTYQQYTQPGFGYQ